MPSSPLDVCVTLTANISDHIKQRVKELFQLKPIWSRVALENNVDEQARPHIRDLLPLFAYMFSKGPWRGIWTRFGYDPRRDQASRMYQICAIRVEDKRQKKRQQPEKDTNSFDETPRTWSPRSHILDENTTEAEYQKYYQLCDLLQPEFLTVIEDTTKFKSSCDAKSGWYTPEALLDLRVLVKQRQLQGPKFSIENISARRETRRGKPFTKSLIEKKKTLAQKRKRTEPSIPSPTTTAELELQPQQETANTSTNAVSNDDSHGGSSSSTTSNVVVFKENPVHEQRILPDASAYQLLSQEDIDEFDIIDEDEDDEAD